MTTRAEATLAKLRRIMPEGWDEHRPDRVQNARLLGQIHAALYPQPPVRAKILAYVERRGGAARMAEIRDDVGVLPGAISGHLRMLVRQGRLVRPLGPGGPYALPDRVPEVLPPRPSEKIAAAARARRKQPA